MVKTVESPDNAWVRGAPPSTVKETFPVGVPAPELTVTVMLAFVP
jgi:hypothetical protein